MHNLFKDLNKSQEMAVKRVDGSILILAGAGSGKTKTITTRLAYLIANGIDPLDTLTLTFTNKAAKEMESRALSLMDRQVSRPLLCTFHKFGLLFLKRYMHLLNRENSFNIIDSDDCKKIIKNINRDISASLILKGISNFKNSLITIDMAKQSAELKNDKIIAEVYEIYQNYLKEENLVDFDDLLLLTYEILKIDENLARRISNRYRYIMVDEYQDTNTLQFKLLQRLTLEHNNLCVVGDDDQSIYSFRGAKVNNILQFEKEFKDTFIVRLEKNYRSTPEIIECSNNLIRENLIRHEKKLIATKPSGRDVIYKFFSDERDESRHIINQIKNLNTKLSSVAILFRISSISRSIEEALNLAKMPYKMVGGFKFYEREEIKDLISYFRVISNPLDNFSIRRILNKPKRGVGKAKIEKIELNKTKSIFEFLDKNSTETLTKLLTKKVAIELKNLVNSIKELQIVAKNSPEELSKELFEKVPLKEQYLNSLNAEDKIRNIDEFCANFNDLVDRGASLENFLDTVALASDTDELRDDKLSLMSVHASKGLEFDYVFVIGLEEDIFPILDLDIEEERRLGYVAFTRAKTALFLSSCGARFHRGKKVSLLNSRFLYESGVIDAKSETESIKLSAGFKKGDVISHKVFGYGKVLDIEISRRDTKLKIEFESGIKNILSQFVEKIS